MLLGISDFKELEISKVSFWEKEPVISHKANVFGKQVKDKND